MRTNSWSKGIWSERNTVHGNIDDWEENGYEKMFLQEKNKFTG
jgi:hypothetical protein